MNQQNEYINECSVASGKRNNNNFDTPRRNSFNNYHRNQALLPEYVGLKAKRRPSDSVMAFCFAVVFYDITKVHRPFQPQQQSIFTATDDVFAFRALSTWQLFSFDAPTQSTDDYDGTTSTGAGGSL
jgi:hypothetical protein